MAASKELLVEEDRLCCYICLELYDNPRLLPCLHSFCHQCLVGYAKTAIGGKGKQHINCPICRADMKLVSKVSNNVEKWVESLPVNVTLVSILSKKKQKPGSRCEQCLRDQTEAPATVYCYECSEKLCNSCRDIHRKVKVLSSHKLCDIEISDETVAKLNLLKTLTRCPDHQSEEIRYICIDHDQLCCAECAVFKHRKCNSIVPVIKALDKIPTSTRYRIKELGNYLKTLTDYETKYKSTIAVYKGEMEEKLKYVKERFDKAFHAMEEAITCEFEAKSSGLLKESALLRQEIETLKTEVSLLSRKLEAAEEFGQPLHVFLAERILQNEIREKIDKTELLYDKMSTSNRIVPVVETIKCNEIEKMIAGCLCVTMESQSTNVPMYPETLKFKSWRDAVRSTEKASNVYQPDNSAVITSTLDICPEPEHTINPDREVEQSNDYRAKEDFNEISSDDEDSEDTDFERNVNPYKFTLLDFFPGTADSGLSRRQRKQQTRRGKQT